VRDNCAAFLGWTLVIRWLESFAILLIGLSSWTLVSGIFAAASWQIAEAPEGNTLFAKLDLAVQLPNLVPVALLLFTPEGWIAVQSRAMTAALLVFGLVDSLWLALAFNVRTETSSVGLLIGAGGGGLLGTLSMIVFFSFAATLQNSASITNMSAGVGGCGLIAQSLAYVRPGSRKYFLALAALQLAGVLAIAALSGPSFLRRARLSEDRLAIDMRVHNCSSDDSENASAYAEVEPEPGRVTCPTMSAPTTADAVEHSGCALIRHWLARHLWGIRSAGLHPLIGVATTCVFEFSMPGLLPFLAPTDDERALFWLTAFWNVSSIVGRLAASCHTLSRFFPANAIQGSILLAAIIWPSATSTSPPIALSLGLVTLFSALHGLVVTSAYVAASGCVSGMAYIGLANQVGALLGSLLSFLLVFGGAMPHDS